MRVMTALFLMSFLTASIGHAKTAADCKKELHKTCQTKRGKDRLECMREGAKQLDAECQQIISEIKSKLSGGDDHPCKTDRDKCTDDGSGGHSKVIKCLLDRRAELSDSCKAHIDDRVSKMPCFEDRMKHCPDTKVGNGRIYDCLKSKEAQLSQSCKEKLAKSKKSDFDTED